MKNKIKFIIGSLFILAVSLSFLNSPIQTSAVGSWWNNDDATTKACTYLVQKLGYTRYAAAGILGNFRHESNVNPYVRERIGNHYTYSLGKEKADKLDPDNNGFGPGWGLAQWGDGSGAGGLGSSRWIELLNYTNVRKGTRYSAAYNDSFKYGVWSNQESVRANIPGLYEQLDFVKYEMRPNSGYVSQWDLNQMTSIDQTADAVLYQYEKSSTKTQNKRRQNAHDIYKYNCSAAIGYDYTVSNIGYIDQLSVVMDKLKITGWHAASRVNQQNLRYMFIMDAVTGKEIKRLPVANVIRDDVARVFPYLPTSRTSGFNIEIPITNELRGKKIFVVTRYLPGTNPNESIADQWFRENQISITNTPAVSEKVPSIHYQTQVQKLGWQKYAKDGELGGFTGQGLRLESLRITLTNLPVAGGVTYSTYMQNVGWQTLVSDNQVAGLPWKSLRMEMIRVQLTGEIANQYDVYYRTNIQNYGWLGWSKNGASAGSDGKSLRIEAIEIKLVKKGQSVPNTGKSLVLKNGSFAS